jgi:hypothetical protein
MVCTGCEQQHTQNDCRRTNNRTPAMFGVRILPHQC